jgi:hypothetical protein
MQARSIPRRIMPPGPARGGSLGWEPAGVAPACADLTDPAAEPFVLAGWYQPEPGGRWTAADATLFLGRPAGGRARLELRGINHHPDPKRLRVTVAGKPALDREIAAGPFQVEEPLSGVQPAGTVMLKLTVAPPSIPAQRGSGDPRTLGLYFRSICLR